MRYKISSNLNTFLINIFTIFFIYIQAKKYPTNHKAFQILYGITQNQDTGDYILVQSYTINMTTWISGNEKIDDFIQEMQLKIDSFDDIVFEWIPYNQFDNIKEICEYEFITIYSAIWKYGSLYYDSDRTEYTKKQFDKNKNVTLKFFCNSQADKFSLKV